MIGVWFRAFGDPDPGPGLRGEAQSPLIKATQTLTPVRRVTDTSPGRGGEGALLLRRLYYSFGGLVQLREGVRLQKKAFLAPGAAQVERDEARPVLFGSRGLGFREWIMETTLGDYIP